MRSSDHMLCFLVPIRKFVGCAMDLVSATEMIDATTAVAEAGKSECYPSHLKDLTVTINAVSKRYS